MVEAASSWIADGSFGRRRGHAANVVDRTSGSLVVGSGFASIWLCLPALPVVHSDTTNRWRWGRWRLAKTARWAPASGRVAHRQNALRDLWVGRLRQCGTYGVALRDLWVEASANPLINACALRDLCGRRHSEAQLDPRLAHIHRSDAHIRRTEGCGCRAEGLGFGGRALPAKRELSASSCFQVPATGAGHAGTPMQTRSVQPPGFMFAFHRTTE